jgi:hypothetical protein
MQWTYDQFYRAAEPVLPRYMQDNGWFHWDRKRPRVHIEDAWKLYAAANSNELGMLLLGDAKIRTNSPLMMNFGLSSGNAFIAPIEQAGIDAVQAQRDALAAPGAGPAMTVLGAGSILNDQLWSPMMNDAFVLAGAHDAQEFHWAEEEFDQFEVLASRQSGTSSLGQGPAFYRDRWKQYLLGRGNFWAGGFVRVFARELIGLNAFGYKPVFSSIGVGFERHDLSGSPDFLAYLDALKAAGFSTSDSAAINAALGRFLFDDPSALASLSTAGAKAPAGAG